jgi:hypothetical protein
MGFWVGVAGFLVKSMPVSMSGLDLVTIEHQ